MRLSCSLTFSRVILPYVWPRILGLAMTVGGLLVGVQLVTRASFGRPERTFTARCENLQGGRSTSGLMANLTSRVHGRYRVPFQLASLTVRPFDSPTEKRHPSPQTESPAPS